MKTFEQMSIGDVVVIHYSDDVLELYTVIEKGEKSLRTRDSLNNNTVFSYEINKGVKMQTYSSALKAMKAHAEFFV